MPRQSFREPISTLMLKRNTVPEQTELWIADFPAFSCWLKLLIAMLKYLFIQIHNVLNYQCTEQVANCIFLRSLYLTGCHKYSDHFTLLAMLYCTYWN